MASLISETPYTGACPQDGPLTAPERTRLRELERENRELRMKNQFLARAVALTGDEGR